MCQVEYVLRLYVLCYVIVDMIFYFKCHIKVFIQNQIFSIYTAGYKRQQMHISPFKEEMEKEFENNLY